ncbi:hypothetical protein ACHHV8_09990 [Paenibacillus sp. TAB 01]|uniref:hypothetical protein n=1 Tax=Paenibacillus sp. TAB 01 TaxID=3368988 RepID=UPI003750D067
MITCPVCGPDYGANGTRKFNGREHCCNTEKHHGFYHALQYTCTHGLEYKDCADCQAEDYVKEMNEQRSSMQLDIGNIVFFEKEKDHYIVKASNYKFSICVTSAGDLYTIIDWSRGQRNRNNLIFNPYDYRKQEDIERCLRDLSDPEHVCELSQRGAVDLDIVKVEQA